MVRVYGLCARIPGRMAWASLKVAVQDRHDGLDLEYPGPHGLGLIEGNNSPRMHVALVTRIPGRMAWASLKEVDGDFAGEYKVSVSRAAWPGPH